MKERPHHLTEREFRLLLFIEERAADHDRTRQHEIAKFGYAAELSTAAHEAGARELRKLARRIRSGEIPGW